MNKVTKISFILVAAIFSIPTALQARDNSYDKPAIATPFVAEQPQTSFPNINPYDPNNDPDNGAETRACFENARMRCEEMYRNCSNTFECTAEILRCEDAARTRCLIGGAFRG
jgi:hypothetical protein